MDLQNYLEKLSSRALVNVMYEALDFMQGWNGRTKNECVLMAIDAKPIHDTNKWTLPDPAEIEKRFG